MELVSWRRTWRVVVEFLVEDVPPWDRGSREAHTLSSAPTERIQECLDQAKARREELLTRLLPGRRRYLGGLIWGLEQELRRREKVESSGRPA